MSVGFRLERQHLKRSAEAGAQVAVARRLCGLHAQVMSSADLQLLARVKGHEPDALARALWEDRTLVKTWLMRGTLHVVSVDDLGVFTGALDNRGEYAGAWLRAFGATAKQMEGLIDAIGNSLDGACLTREELIGGVEPRVGRSFAKRLRSGWGEFLKPAARRADRPLPQKHLARVYRKQGWISATVVERGSVVGVWTYAKRGRKVELAVEQFEPFAERIRAAVRCEARSVARHLGGELELTWG